MKKSKLTIAVLSACMLAATGGISLGAAALANAPEAANASESGLIARDGISNGIAITKREVSRSGDAMSFTYTVSPSYANVSVSAVLSWNANGVSDQIGTYLEVTSHNTSTKTVTVSKKARFTHQAKLVLTDANSSASATVLIDCGGTVTLNQNAPTTFQYTSNYNRETNAGAEVESLFTYAAGSLDGGVTITDVSFEGSFFYWDESAAWSNTGYQNASNEMKGQIDEQLWSYELQEHFFAIEPDQYLDADILDNSGRARSRYVHVSLMVEIELTWAVADANHTGQATDCTYVVPTFIWNVDMSSLAYANAITPEAGHIYF